MEPMNPLAEIVPPKQEVVFRGHTIELRTEPGAVPFTPEHIARITPVLEFYWDVNPEIVKAYTFLRSQNRPDATNFSTFRASGSNSVSPQTRGIDFFNFGMDIAAAHRVSPTSNPAEHGFIDNFSGTLAHEMAHIGAGGSGGGFFNDSKLNTAFIMDWSEQFGWKRLFPMVQDETTNRWSQSDTPAVGWVRNAEGFWQNGEYILYTSTDPRQDKNIEYTTMPEKCIGGVNSYASSTLMQEDICDSMAAYALQSDMLDPDKKMFIQQKIAEYRNSQE
jgi:hypothetical protein